MKISNRATAVNYPGFDCLIPTFFLPFQNKIVHYKNTLTH
jgi:hypothetical protein